MVTKYLTKHYKELWGIGTGLLLANIVNNEPLGSTTDILFFMVMLLCLILVWNKYRAS